MSPDCNINLSRYDQQILDRIFNQETEANSGSIKFEPPTNAKEEQSRAFEREAIQLAESGEKVSLEEALVVINESINLSPHHPSPYNNKAQILRLMDKDEEAEEVLQKALRLASGQDRFKAVERQASAQLGWLKFKCEEREEAFKYFEIAGKLGCPESRKMAIRCNPYAAMCNAMLQEIMSGKHYSNQ